MFSTSLLGTSQTTSSLYTEPDGKKYLVLWLRQLSGLSSRDRHG